MGILVVLFLNATWSPKFFGLLSDDPQYGSWSFNRLDDRMLFTHFWFYKKWLEEHPLAKLELEQQLLHELVTRFPEEPLDMLQFAK